MAHVKTLYSDVASLDIVVASLRSDVSISARPRGTPARLAFSIGFSNGFARFPAGDPGAAVQRPRVECPQVAKANSHLTNIFTRFTDNPSIVF